MSLSLFTPLKAGALELKNRIVMAPLTRCRATGADGRTPNELMKKYYEQRASAGLIITEATAISPMAVGYANTPGIWSEEHVKAWRDITNAVHAKNGQIVLQLWHVGRISHPMFLNGETPVSASAIAAEGYVSLVRPRTAYPVPRALEISEISKLIKDYQLAAENAKRSGFDGVELHAANGYLLDQFLHDGSNQRRDQYGGSIENRARLLLETTDAVTSVWGADRVGVHLAPRGDSHSMTDSNPEALFTFVAEELRKRKIAFICTRESVGVDSLSFKLKRIFKGVFIGNEKFTLESAQQALDKGDVDAVAFGRDFIANPDLVERLKIKAPLNPQRPETFYAAGATGYTDYPFLENTKS